MVVAVEAGCVTVVVGPVMVVVGPVIVDVGPVTVMVTVDPPVVATLLVDCFDVEEPVEEEVDGTVNVVVIVMDVEEVDVVEEEEVVEADEEEDVVAELVVDLLEVDDVV